ncbi:uroporphyrinogen-III C-methyltransferase [Geoglobus acetivorans]|uniref:uroporphyrinogen-III C-methyltransferase n=1 Tax=Geoglobus acetivorans TaxID=565033 RepID=A0A0A7GGA6_GEOAI|nr:Uroporphyrinogen-III methyltransferase [Geoglobus acetivorans]
MRGFVYIVGAGPGDPELITLRGLKALEKADVILYDALIDEGIFELVDCENKELVYAGKRKGDGNGEKRQKEINEMMKKYALEGKTVARLKGGDPGIFGRLADEILFLKANRIPFEIIPGVSSLNGVPVLAGIPLTARGISSLTVLSGREDFGIEAILGGTFVVMMGRDSIQSVAERMIEIGISPDKPAVAIENGTLDTQRIVKGRLKNIGEKMRDFKGPVLFIVGDVADLLP